MPFEGIWFASREKRNVGLHKLPRNTQVITCLYDQLDNILIRRTRRKREKGDCEREREREREKMTHGTLQ